MWGLLLGGDHADFNFFEADGFESVNLPPRLPFIPFPWQLIISQSAWKKPSPALHWLSTR